MSNIFNNKVHNILIEAECHIKAVKKTEPHRKEIIKK